MLVASAAVDTAQVHQTRCHSLTLIGPIQKPKPCFIFRPLLWVPQCKIHIGYRFLFSGVHACSLSRKQWSWLNLSTGSIEVLAVLIQRCQVQWGAVTNPASNRGTDIGVLLQDSSRIGKLSVSPCPYRCHLTKAHTTMAPANTYFIHGPSQFPMAERRARRS